MSDVTTKSRGDAAEEVVATWLESQGIQIVARNLRLGKYEIDIVAREERLVLVIEVRTRSARSWTSAFSSISPSKRARVRRAGSRLWDRRYRNDSTVDRLRYDAVSVTYEHGIAKIEYIRAAF